MSVRAKGAFLPLPLCRCRELEGPAVHMLAGLSRTFDWFVELKME